MHLLNPRTPDSTLLKANYDKLLHFAGSFTALVWLSKIAPKPAAFVVVLILCLLKTIWNYRCSSRYNPIGDWLANMIGFGLWYIY